MSSVSVSERNSRSCGLQLQARASFSNCSVPRVAVSSSHLRAIQLRASRSRASCSIKVTPGFTETSARTVLTFRTRRLYAAKNGQGVTPCSFLPSVRADVYKQSQCLTKGTRSPFVKTVDNGFMLCIIHEMQAMDTLSVMKQLSDLFRASSTIALSGNRMQCIAIFSANAPSIRYVCEKLTRFKTLTP